MGSPPIMCTRLLTTAMEENVSVRRPFAAPLLSVVKQTQANK